MERKGLGIAVRVETKPQETKPRFAKVEEPKILAVPEQKLPVGGYTVNIGSFREKGNMVSGCSGAISLDKAKPSVRVGRKAMGL